MTCVIIPELSSPECVILSMQVLGISVWPLGELGKRVGNVALFKQFSPGPPVCPILVSKIW